MNNRPRIELPLNQTDKILELLGWGAIVGIWALTMANYFELPEVIPIHFNRAGEVDGFGSKEYLLLLPIVSTVMFIILSLLSKIPHFFNYTTKITDENAAYQYTNAIRLLRFLKLTTVLVFGLIVFKTIQHVNGNSEGLGTWFIPITMLLTFVPLIYFLINSAKQKSTKK